MFPNLAALVAYINQYLVANGMDTITGSQLNTALLGLCQFVGEAQPVIYTPGPGIGISSTNQIFVQDSGVVGGTYGSSLLVPQIAVNALGQVISAANVSIGTSGVTGYTTGGWTGTVSGATSIVIGTVSFTPTMVSVTENDNLGGTFGGHGYSLTWVGGTITAIFSAFGGVTGTFNIKWVAFTN